MSKAIVARSTLWKLHLNVALNCSVMLQCVAVVCCCSNYVVAVTMELTSANLHQLVPHRLPESCAQENPREKLEVSRVRGGVGGVRWWCVTCDVRAHTHIHTYTHTRIHTYTHTHIHTYTHTHIHPYTHANAHIHTLTHVQIHPHKPSHIRTYTHTHIHIRLCVITTYTRKYVYTHVHTYTRTYEITYSYKYTSEITHSLCHSYSQTNHMGWLRLVDFLKL